MKKRIIKIIAGVLFIVGAFWPASLAISLLVYIIIPRLKAGSNVTVHESVFINEYELQGWYLYAVPAVAALASIGLVVAGLFLIFQKSDDGRQC